MNDTQKIGAYLCQGCGLGERLDSARLAEVATQGGAAVVRKHDYLCSNEGVSLIRDDIKQQGVTHVVIGACSRRAKTEAFNFDFDSTQGAPAVALARANLREGVIWSQPHRDDESESESESTSARETTQEMADDYVRMGCAEVKFMRPPTRAAESESENGGGNRRILVVGGGISGLTAALESARAGYAVLLVEKRAQLGGWSRDLYRHLPQQEPYAHPQANHVGELIKQVQAERNITLFLHATITRTSGAPGRFSVDITRAANAPGKALAPVTENVGAIVQASGFSRYDANQLPQFAYGKTADVVDQMELERLFKTADEHAATKGAAGASHPNRAPIKRPSDGKAITSVIFVQCAGQRSQQAGHLPYCSGYCCNVSLKQAMYFKRRDPAIDTNVIYRDLRVPGHGEDFYRSAQQQGVAFTNGEVKQVRVEGDQLAVHFHDHILAEDAIANADLVVLATGQVPNSGAVLANAAASPAAAHNSDKQNAAPPRAADSPAQAAQVTVSVESILNLDYRQGADLPHLKHGFSDSHFLCFPYETRRTGIYACGPVRRPMDIQQAMEDATGAALKAIQAVENAGLGRAAHPRSGDLSFPSFRRDGCTQCKRCTVECPFGAIDEDEDGYPQFNESRCRRCGTCMGACPVRVISFDNYSVDTVGQQIKAIDMPDEFDEKPRILILACENDAYPALDMAAHNRLEYNAFVRVIPIRCLGSVNAIWVTDALSAGFDGIMLMGCKKGEDYQCHFVTGAELAHERMGKIDDTLNQLQLEPQRVRTLEVEITDLERVPKLINDYAAEIDAIGMNPFKGF